MMIVSFITVVLFFIWIAFLAFKFLGEPEYEEWQIKQDYDEPW